MSDKKRCGFVAIIGRPNVGKSTLLNAIIGAKISITARKPQTTRHRVLGIQTRGDIQAVFIDTPGLHTKAKKALNRTLNRAAMSAMLDVDVVLFMIEAKRWADDDQWILDKLSSVKQPVILLINKIDRVKNKRELMPFLQKMADKYPFVEIVPLSATQGDNVDQLNASVAKYLPESVHLFPCDQVTDRGERFLVTEIIREKLIRHLGEEVPHSIAITLDKYIIEDNVRHISVVVWVEREGQKKIVIGKNGAVLKKIGTLARKELEDYFEQKVFLQCWVKVKKQWSDDVRALRYFGVDES